MSSSRLASAGALSTHGGIVRICDGSWLLELRETGDVLYLIWVIRKDSY